MTDHVLHSPIGASSKERWGNCPGSRKLTEGMTSTQSEHAALGSHAHSVGEQILKEDKDGDVEAHFRMVETEELMAAVMVYVELIRAEAADADIAYIEKGFDLSNTIHPLLFGTCDAIHFYKKKKLLRVYDYKHGVGKAVKPEHNDQLLYYALGALLEIPHLVETIELVIVQPRCPRGGEVIHRWQFKTQDVMFDFALELKLQAEATEKPDAPLKTGGWCWFCPAALSCPEKLKEQHAKAQEFFTPISPITAETKNLKHGKGKT